MAIVPAFTISQSALTPQNITAVDSSTGSDGLIAARRIYFITTEGEYLVEDGVATDYNDWPLADTTDTWDVLDVDQALEIRVDWVGAGGNILYTLTQVFCLPQYNKNQFYYLIGQQATTPSILQDGAYFSNLATYWMNITGAIQAVEIGADIAASQECLNRATNMLNNENLFF